MFKVSIKAFLDSQAQNRNPSFSLFWIRAQETFQEFEEDLRAIDGAILDLYTHHISMPGQIVRANTDSIEGNTATWEIPFLILIFRDATMEIESRRFNWLIPGLGIPALFLAAFGLTAVVRHRKSRSSRGEVP
jgi:hypothetical protein